MTLCAAVAALLCVSSFLYIPMAVPITLQTLVLYFSLFTLGGKVTSAAVAVYIALGTVGIPVFSGFSGGIARLFDATGGFIFGLLFSAILYWIFELLIPESNAWLFIKSALSLALLYAVGSLWYFFVYLYGEGSFMASLAVTVFPFVVPDAVKILIAYLISKGLLKRGVAR